MSQLLFPEAPQASLAFVRLQSTLWMRQANAIDAKEVEIYRMSSPRCLPYMQIYQKLTL